MMFALLPLPAFSGDLRFHPGTRHDRFSAASASDVLVRFAGVRKTYDGETLVVKDLNLEIRRGEFLTLLGPSGSGKTTSLMMLAGFEVPTDGEIELAGRSIRNVPPHQRGIGMVFQNYALFPHMTIEENVAFPLMVRGMGPRRAQRQGARGAVHGEAGGPVAAASGAAFRRAAAARRAGPRPGVRTAAGADGRAPGRARQAAARAHADRDQAPAPEPGSDRGLRHPRPDRGADHVGPYRGVQRRRDPAAGCAARPLRGAAERLRRRTSSARTTCSPRHGGGDAGERPLPRRARPTAITSPARGGQRDRRGAGRPACRCGPRRCTWRITARSTSTG